jgi:hypothetical protein
MRSIRLLAVAVLAVVLALSSTQNVFSGTWIIYDDGAAEQGISNVLGCMAVRFSAPPGSLLLRIAYYRTFTTEIAFNLYILDSDGQTVLFGPQSTTPVGPEGWFYVDVNIVVPGDFYTAACWPQPDPDLGVDTDNGGQTFIRYAIGDWEPFYWGSGPANLMIRAELGSSAVGGVVTTVNTFSVLAPWIAVIAVVGCIGTIAVIAKKHQP